MSKEVEIVTYFYDILYPIKYEYKCINKKFLFEIKNFLENLILLSVKVLLFISWIKMIEINIEKELCTL